MQEVIGFIMIVSVLFWLINTSLKGLNKVLSFIVLGALATRFGMPLISNRLPEVGSYFERGIDYFQTRVLPIFQGDEFAANNPEFGGTSQDQFQRRPYDGTQREPYLNGSNGTAGSSQDRPFDESPDAAQTPIDENAPPVPEGRTSIPYDDDLQNGGTPDSSSQPPVTAWW